MDDLVTLEAYADENRALIHNGRNDEAIAICKHILYYYPKHIDSYRQLGEAFLEKEEYDNATDMFRRVLSADPENAIVYVGLASIFEQQHLIEEAVWHLERANEITPGNFEIQKELLRKYSEATKPRQRVKLSHTGLARLYNQEGLYSQAIQELRTITDESPTRFDARVALAETLWHAGRIRESAETAQGILKSLPYCLKANLIIGAAWKESGLPDSAMYLSRAQELDPTNKFAARLFGPRSPLAVTEVSVPRYIEGTPPRPLQQQAPITPSATEPVKPPEEETNPELADFFAETSTETAPIVETAEADTKPDLPGANLPSWLLSETESEGKITQAQEPAETEPTEAGTPAWSTGIEQTKAAPAEEMLEENAESEKLPPWLESTEKTLEPKLTEEVENIPAWLAEQPSTETEEAAPGETAEIESDKLPAWMEDSGQPDAAFMSVEEETQAAELEPSEAMPDWMRTLQQAPAEPVTPIPQEETAPIEDYVTPTVEEPKPVEEPVATQEPLVEATLTDQSTTDAASETLRETESPTPPPVPSAPPIVVEMPTAQPPTSKRKRQPKGYPHLIQAREHRDANRLGDALLEYDWLVQHAPRLVSDVIDDLEIVTARTDAPLEAHRILGDAYTRADRLSDALQRYQFVLERSTESSTS